MRVSSLFLIFKLLFEIFVLTVILEIIVSYILGVRNKKNILTIIFVNFVTNVTANVMTIYLKPSNSQIIIFEIIIIAIEGFMYWKLFFNEDKFLLNCISCKWIRFCFFSLIVNLTSFLFGKIFFN